MNDFQPPNTVAVAGSRATCLDCNWSDLDTANVDTAAQHHVLYAPSHRVLSIRQYVAVPVDGSGQ